MSKCVAVLDGEKITEIRVRTKEPKPSQEVPTEQKDANSESKSDSAVPPQRSE